MDNKIINITSSSELLTKYMTIDATSNSNLFRNDFPTDNLYEGRIIFLKVPETTNISMD